MHYKPIYIDPCESERLLTCGNKNTLALFLYLRNGNDLSSAAFALGCNADQIRHARTQLEELGLFQIESQPRPEHRPQYTEKDLLNATAHQKEFQTITQEVQTRLGKVLNTEELKILLNITNYLGMPLEVICILVSYCITRSKHNNIHKVPTMYQIEKEAYRWSDAGVEDKASALAHICQMDQYRSNLNRMAKILQIQGRRLSPPEERMANEWLQLGFTDEMYRIAYERTCMRCGGFNWSYMNKILHAWQEAGYKKPEETNRQAKQTVPMGATGELGEAELDAIRRVLSEE